jgi:hypothetical protein
MTNLYIYGDSFADPNWNIKHNCNFVWPVEIAKRYNVKNFALKGTGPEYSLQCLMETHSVPKDSVCIFVVSDVNRMNLHNFWKHDQEQVHILDVAAKRIKHPGYMFVRQLYDHYLTDHTHLLRTAQSIAGVNSLSSKFARTLILTIAPVPVDLRLDSSVDFVNHGLLDLSEAEWQQDKGGDPYVDTRPNHFSEPNHRVMLDLLARWVDQETVPDVAQFHQAIV